jgi:hypothetical protein
VLPAEQHGDADVRLLLRLLLGVLMRRVMLTALLLAGCAKAGISNMGGDGGGAQHDLAGADFAGADFAGGGGNDDMAIAPGADLSGGGGTPDLLITCDPVAQTGCGPGEKCTLGATGTTCLSNGNKATGQQCGTGGADDCVAGDLCSVDSMTATTDMCREFCNTDTDCHQPAAPAGATAEPKNGPHCIITFTGTTAKACTVPCNPVTRAGASGCPGTLACVYGGTATIPELTDCSTPGSKLDGAVCADSSECANGLVCVGSAATYHCRQVCRNATPGDCSGAGYLCAVPAGVTAPMFGFCCPGAGC